MSAGEENLTESPATPRTARADIGLAAAALILPVLAGILLFFVTSFVPAFAVSTATVLITAILLAIDAHRLPKVNPTAVNPDSPWLLFFGMILLWIAFYPYTFFRRKRFGGPNLTIPSILVALFFLLGPLARTLLVPPGLPACTSPEVVQVLDRAIHQIPLGTQVKSIDGHREISYDRANDRRRGECVLHTGAEDIVVEFVVGWRDRARAEFEVRTLPILPSCASQDVANVLEKMIRGAPAGARVQAIDGYREVSYDSVANRRQGECVAHIDGSGVAVKFVVRWRDREKGKFEVELTK
jgi:hypothetical protein